jgi:hypothetical protein
VTGLDVARLSRIVVQRPPQFLDAGRQRLVADRLAVPNDAQQFLLGH